MGSFTDFISPLTGQYHAASQSDYRVTEQKAREREALATQLALQKAQEEKIRRGPSLLEEEDVRSQIARRAAQSENERFGSVVDYVTNRGRKQPIMTPRAVLEQLAPEIAKALPENMDIPLEEALNMGNLKTRRDELQRNKDLLGARGTEAEYQKLQDQRNYELQVAKEADARFRTRIDAFKSGIDKRLGSMTEEEKGAFKPLYDEILRNLKSELGAKEKPTPEYVQQLSAEIDDPRLLIKTLEEEGYDTSDVISALQKAGILKPNAE